VSLLLIILGGAISLAAAFVLGWICCAIIVAGERADVHIERAAEEAQ